MSKATKNELNELHALVAKVIKDKLKSGEFTTQELNAAINFLKNNGVQADPDFSADLQDIRDTVVDITTLPFKVVGNETSD